MSKDVGAPWEPKHGVRLAMCVLGLLSVLPPRSDAFQVVKLSINVIDRVSAMDRILIPSSRSGGARLPGRGASLSMKVKFDAGQDYYLTLGVPDTAVLNDIKRAYRRLALKTHPDVNKASNAAEQFKKICEAYKVLSDPESRKQYDLARKYRDPSSFYGRRTGGASSGGGSSQWDAYEAAGFRRPKEETADSIDDSFGKIFNDFIGTVSSSRGGRSIFEDLVDFLEDQVDGFSDDSSDDLEELLRSDNLSEIQEEVENLNFLILKLREKLSKSQLDRMMAESEVRNFKPDPRDLEGMEKRMEKIEREAALRARCADLEGHIKRADKRQRRLMLRAEELRWGPGGSRPAYSKYAKPGTSGSASQKVNTGSTGGGYSSSSGSAGYSSTTSTSTSSSSGTAGASGASSRTGPSGGGSGKRSDAVEEELKKLKKQMGMGE